jgi:hypothetical protein
LTPLQLAELEHCLAYRKKVLDNADDVINGTLRREYLDRTLFWTITDLEAKLLDFQHHYNEHRTHAGRQGHPPVTGVNADHSLANLSCYRRQKHCRLTG